MPTYISILRGINESGQKKILMADLKKLYEDLGLKQVETYIQSGNVVFDSDIKDKKELEQLIFNKIQAQYEFEIPNIILTSDDLGKVLNNNPYNQIDLMYFTFLSEQPSKENIGHLNTYEFDNEFFEVGDKVIYFHCPNGAGRAKMGNNFFEQKLKVTATSRNHKTVKKLLEMAKFTNL